VSAKLRSATSEPYHRPGEADIIDAMGVRAAVIAVACAGGCGRIGFDTVGVGDAGMPCASYGPWGGLARLVISTPLDEWGPWLSPDGLDLWFSQYDSVQVVTNVLHAHRFSLAVPFSSATAEIVPLGPLGGKPDLDAQVFLSDDQLHIYWDHFQGSFNIVWASRATTAEDFGPEDSLAIDQDSVLHTFAPALTQDRLTLVYVQGPSPPGSSGYLYITTHAHPDDDFTDGQQLVGPGPDPSGAAINSDASEIYWGDGPIGGQRLVRSTRIDATTYTTPVVIEGQPLGATDDNSDPMLTRDGKTLVFARDQADGNRYDLWSLTRACN
jgi:hypothetical protein